ncbi:DUF1415 domain-containing protein [Allohahella marinimesophila]|uniref:DUF1415 domain-containing protein n=1 Tax=Allohahella marinimesophila TaxID=1054972 RepID=A0ABP7NW27_9GAMM
MNQHTTVDDAIVDSVRQWLTTMVVGLNLCPFAKRELVKNRIRFSVTKASSESELLHALKDELMLLDEDESIETTLLIHPHVLADFREYNDFLAEADGLLDLLDREGIYQVASFHPDYQFGGTHPDDAENYTNRSPVQMLHILREDSLEKAIDEYPDVEGIPERNIALMNEMGVERLKALLGLGR